MYPTPALRTSTWNCTTSSKRSQSWNDSRIRTVGDHEKDTTKEQRTEASCATTPFRPSSLSELLMENGSHRFVRPWTQNAHGRDDLLNTITCWCQNGCTHFTLSYTWMIRAMHASRCVSTARGDFEQGFPGPIVKSGHWFLVLIEFQEV